MRYPRVSLALLLLCVLAGIARAGAEETTPSWDFQSRGGDVLGSFLGSKTVVATNGVVVRYTDTNGLAVLEADKANIDVDSGDIYAEGSVRIQRGNQTWVSDHVHYNFKTHLMDAEKFRVGSPPFYLGGVGLRGAGEGTNDIFHGTNSFITTDDNEQPFETISAKRFTIVPNQYIVAYDAWLWIGGYRTFYFPYYRRRLTHEQNEFSFVPGYRSIYGPYLLGSYDWVWDETLRGALHLDYRQVRGVGAGPDVNFNYGDLGQGTMRYYYAHDEQPGNDPFTGAPIPADRQRAYFTDNSHPFTNFTVMSQIAYQTDPYITRDFFESQYNKDTQPKTFVDANQAWQNWSLDALVTKRLNPFWETVERLPDVRLSGFRQQIFDLPVFYESESSMGYYRRLFSNTNSIPPGVANVFLPSDFAGSRIDTFHQLTMPETFFGWLNVTPRVGGRYTYYDETSNPGGGTTNHNRTVFETGAEVSFTASRVWENAQCDALEINGLRHIFQPSIDYSYVPQPSVLPGQLPQFDYELTNNLRLLPLEFPQFNDIGSINSQNTIRYGLNNRLQTKRNGDIIDLADWSVYMDWNLRPFQGETTFSDIFSDLTLRPRSWLTFQSFVRYSIAQGQFNLSEHSITLQPNNTWNWTGSHLYLRNGPIFGQGDDLFTSVFFYRLNENWGARVAHYFDATSGTLQEQDYTIYRDLRSWTAALTFRALDSQANGRDYGVAFTFSFKSFPHFAVGADSVRSAALVGY